MKAPDAWPHRELFLSVDPDASICTVLIDAGADPTATDLDAMRDLIHAERHVLFAAQDTAGLALFAAAFKRLVQQAPAATVH